MTNLTYLNKITYSVSPINSFVGGTHACRYLNVRLVDTRAVR